VDTSSTSTSRIDSHGKSRRLFFLDEPVLSQRQPITSFGRIAAVTLSLSAIGAVVGAGLGALALWGLSVAIRNPRSIELIGPAALFGGLLGAVLAPIAAWTLMRHVPIWRAIVETALGTAVGLAIGWVLGARLGYAALWPIGMGLLGFTIAAIRLRITHRVGRAPPDSEAMPGD
jgi:hypothetical protein